MSRPLFLKLRSQSKLQTNLELLPKHLWHLIQILIQYFLSGVKTDLDQDLSVQNSLCYIHKIQFPSSHNSKVVVLKKKLQKDVMNRWAIIHHLLLAKPARHWADLCTARGFNRDRWRCCLRSERLRTRRPRCFHPPPRSLHQQPESPALRSRYNKDGSTSYCVFSAVTSKGHTQTDSLFSNGLRKKQRERERQREKRERETDRQTDWQRQNREGEGETYK